MVGGFMLVLTTPLLLAHGWVRSRRRPVDITFEADGEAVTDVSCVDVRTQREVQR